MIGCTSSFLAAVSGCTYDLDNHILRAADGSARYLAAVGTTHPGWSKAWALKTILDRTCATCSLSTFASLNGAAALTSPAYLDGCYTTASGGDTYQLSILDGAALPSEPPPPPPP